MRINFLTVAILRAIHSALIEDFGGSHGLRDSNLLESALARPRQLNHYVENARIAELTATLGWGLIKNHAFVDGNKRVALAAMITFLRRNSYKLICSEVEETAMVLRAAASEITEEEWTAWVVRSVVPI